MAVITHSEDNRVNMVQLAEDALSWSALPTRNFIGTSCRVDIKYYLNKQAFD